MSAAPARAPVTPPTGNTFDKYGSGNQTLPFGDGEFDLVAATESLEHVAEPDRALAEMARVTSRHLLVSAPRKPLVRVP